MFCTGFISIRRNSYQQNQNEEPLTLSPVINCCCDVMYNVLLLSKSSTSIVVSTPDVRPVIVSPTTNFNK